MSHNIKDGQVVQLSPSMLNSFDASSPFGCERRGWFKYVKGIKEPSTAAQDDGKHLHKMNEEYLLTGKLLLGTPEQTAWFNAGRHYLDTLRARREGYQGGHKVETLWYTTEAPMPADFRVEGVSVSPMSKCDVVTADSIIDWKTTSDIEKYGKTPGELAKDVQMLIYAKAFHPAAERVTLAHGQYQTKGRVKFNLSSIEMTRSELDGNYEKVIIPLVAKVKEVATATDVSDVAPNRNACRRCPHQAICPSEKDSLIMSIFDKLKKSSSQSATPVPAGILPPDAPKSDPALAAKPVEGFSPVPPPKTTVAQNVGVVAEPTPGEAPRDGRFDEVAKTEPVKRGPGRPPGAKNKPKSVTLTAPVGTDLRGVPEAMEALSINAADHVQFESVTVNYGLTLKLGDGKSYEFVRLDCSMTAKGRDADATYAAVLEKVKANVSAEIEKLQGDIRAAQTLNPNGGGK